ncbi:MAG: class I SAM-dependent methyltransferase [Flavobacteriales bacterium]|nr:class I SAM-dependent methyltransferase [Flavobacteriales bacterium]
MKIVPEFRYVFPIMDQLNAVAKYIRYLSKARTRHGIHSPFVYRFIEEVIRNRSHFYIFDEIRVRRNELKYDNRMIRIADFGAGSGQMGNHERKVRDILTHSAMPERWGKLLYRLVRFVQPDSVLELGTSLGMGSAYLFSACPDAKMISLEGCPQTASVAQETFEKLKLNAKIGIGEFSETLPDALAEISGLGLAFIDGNHRYEPTMKYFEACMPHVQEHSVLVFHDIHWSPGMEAAWNELREDSRVTVSLDLFHMGILFFRKEQTKEHFVLRY